MRDPKVNDYVMVEFAFKSTVYYIGKMIRNKNAKNELEISYIRKTKFWKFVYPNVPEFKLVALQDIKLILPQPRYMGKTSRQNSYTYFKVDLGQFNVK